MAGLRLPFQDILTKLATINVTTPDGLTVPLYARKFNNQIRDEKGSKLYDFQRPAAFVELVSPVTFEIIGTGFRSADIGIKIHLVHDFYNQDGTFEQDLVIYDIRDMVIMALSQYCPTACGPLNCVSEYDDYDHDNLVVYVCEFICNFTDSKGSKYDPTKGLYDETQDPDMDLQVVKDGIPVPVPIDNEYIIPQ